MSTDCHLSSKLSGVEVLRLESRTGRGRAVVRMVGDLCSYSAPVFAEHLRQLAEQGVVDVDLDARDLTVLTAAGVEELLAGARACRDHGGRLEVVEPSAITGRVLHICRATDELVRSKRQPMDHDTTIGSAFVDLADTLVDDYDVIDFLGTLTEHCVTLFGITEAGVVLHQNTTLSAVASSSERMRFIELVELQTEDGPCLDSFRDGTIVAEDDLDRAVERWPHFTPAATDAGFRSVYAVPMRLRADRIGAVNLFADTRAAMDSDALEMAQALADVATIGLLNERFLRHHESVNEQLQVALESRIRIEHAKGMIAVQADIDPDAAFVRIRGHARRHNLRLQDTVSAIINGELDSSHLDAAPSDQAGAPTRGTASTPTMRRTPGSLR